MNWRYEFQPFSLFHLLATGLCVAFMIGLVMLGRRWHGTPREPRLRWSWAAFIAASQVFALIWWFLPGQLDWGRSLPLHVCDIAVLSALLAMVFPKRWLFVLLYFWGIGLSTQAFFTPILQFGWAYVYFWLFWIGHTIIVGSAIYAVVVLGFRPQWRDFGLAVAASLGYLAVVFPLNAIFGFNYGFVGPTEPENPTIVDHLGPWPLRVVWISLLALLALFLAFIPWPIARAIAARRRSGESSPDPQPDDSPGTPDQP